MMGFKKKPFNKKQYNISAMEIGIRKYMREHPLYGEEFKRQEGISKLLKKPRVHRKEGSFISR